MYLLGKLIIYAIIFFVITAFVVVVYRIILSFHKNIMNENTNDHAQVSNTDDQRDASRSGGE
jgi:hypothetical protein